MQPEKPHIALFLSSLGCGGAERLAVGMARAFLARGHNVSVITVYGKESDFFMLPDGARRVELRLERGSRHIGTGLLNNFARLRALRKTLKELKPDVLISFMTPNNVLACIASVGLKIPLVITEHIDPSRYSDGVMWDILPKFTYWTADKLVSVSKGVDEGFGWLAENRRTVIINPVTDVHRGGQFPPGYEAGKQHVLAMGRLVSQKGFDILIKAFARLARKFPQWQLVIIGGGELRAELQSLADELGVNVALVGRLENPFAIFGEDDIFAMPSRFEGMGLALAEAMACGVAVVAADCKSGPAEILNGGEFGLLVPPEDEKALAAALEKLMASGEERASWAKKAALGAKRFSEEEIMPLWFSLIDEL